MDQNRSCPITDYFFSHFRQLSTEYTVPDTEPTLNTKHLKILTRSLDTLAKSLGGRQKFHLPDAPLSLQFSEAVQNTITHFNRAPNPANSGTEHKTRVKDPAYHRALAAFYAEIDRFLTETGTPISRENAVVQPQPAATTPLPSIFRHITDADGTRLEPANCIDLSDKAIICFGGTGCFTGSHKVAEGFAMLAADTLGIAPRQPDTPVVYCVTYPPRHRAGFFSDTHAYNADPERHISPQAQVFFDTALLPLLTDDGGRLLPPRELKHTCAKLNFFTYSYGTVFIQEIRNATCDFLRERGLESGEIRDLLANIYSMNLGTLARLDTDKPDGHFSAVHVISETDLSVMNKSPNMELVQQSGGRLLPLRDNELVIRATPPAQGIIQPSDFDDTVPESAFCSSVDTRTNPSGHGVRFYMPPVTTEEEIVHNPRYIGFGLPEALGLPSAYRRLDERFLPPRPPGDGFNTTPEIA